jgi:hypothetical protein
VSLPDIQGQEYNSTSVGLLGKPAAMLWLSADNPSKFPGIQSAPEKGAEGIWKGKQKTANKNKYMQSYKFQSVWQMQI